MARNCQAWNLCIRLFLLDVEKISQSAVNPNELMTSSKSLFNRAQSVIPGGVNSPVRAFGSVGGTPYFVSRAEGSHIWDADGNRYLDYVMSYGPLILGHAHPAVVDAVAEAAAGGTSYGAPTEREVLLAEELCERIPGMEMVRLVSSGTEATMTAVRLARGATGRDIVVKFAGCYHGHADFLLAAGGSGVANQGLSGCDGVTASAVADTIVAPYNEVPELDERVAAVIVEPVAANMGLVAPEPDFLPQLRDACSKAGALLIFRRGDHRFPPVPRRSGRVVRRAARPLVLRQGNRRRPARRSLRRQARDHGAPSPPRRRLPSRHTLRQPFGDRSRSCYPSRTRCPSLRNPDHHHRLSSRRHSSSLQRSRHLSRATSSRHPARVVFLRHPAEVF